MIHIESAILMNSVLWSAPVLKDPASMPKAQEAITSIESFPVISCKGQTKGFGQAQVLGMNNGCGYAVFTKLELTFYQLPH
jgi:hypothetical protein